MVSLGNGTAVAARTVIDCNGLRSPLLRPHGQRRPVRDRLVRVYQRSRYEASRIRRLIPRPHPTDGGYTAVLPDRWRIIACHTDSDLPAARRVLHQGPANEAMTVRGLSEAIGPIQAAGAGRPQICSANSTARSAAG